MCEYNLHGIKKADQKIGLTIQVPCFYSYTGRLHVKSAAALILIHDNRKFTEHTFYYLGDIEKVCMKGTGE